MARATNSRLRCRVCLPLLALIVVVGACGPGTDLPHAPDGVVIDGRRLSSSVVDRYLEQTIAFTSQGGVARCAHAPIGHEANRVFVETLCLEFVRSADTVANASGRGGPAALTVVSEGDSLRLVSHEVPQDGGGHTASIRRIFPPAIARQLIDGDQTATRSRLFARLKADAEARLLR